MEISHITRCENRTTLHILMRLKPGLLSSEALDCKQTLISYMKKPSLLKVQGSRALQDVFGYVSKYVLKV